MLNIGSISKSVILPKVPVKSVKIGVIFPDVKTIAVSWTRYTLFYPRLSPVQGEVSSIIYWRTA